MSKADDPVAIRTDEAIAAAGVEDMRPGYRTLLRLLKERDPGAFADATARYDEDLVSSIATGEDPVAAWIAYGAWVAERLNPGRLVQLDHTGLATDVVDPATADPALVLLHLPDAEKEAAVVISRPEQPSPAQRSALQLLVR